MYWFTADEHYGHANIIKYCNRPFNSVAKMDCELINRHNSVVGENDTVVHAGDFTLIPNAKIVNRDYINLLRGKHVFLKGSHDRWLPGSVSLWTKVIEGQPLTVFHYCMRSWPASYHGSWLLYGHSHGRLADAGKQHDIGVDNNHFYPVSFEQIKKIMATKENNID
jgi:calcineurin-like phosphoesterase family protein